MLRLKSVRRLLTAILATSLLVCTVAYFHIRNAAAEEMDNSENRLAIPELYEGSVVDGRRQFRLVVDEATKQFFEEGRATTTAGINGPYLGPTLRMKRGENVDLIVENRLSETTTMHWHGMHVPANMDGTPHQEIEPDESWTASFPIDQQAATLWYHPHPHENTGPQVYSGLAGQLWIDDEASGSLDLPNTYGVDDIPVIIQDRNFTRSNQFRRPVGIGLGQVILINGTRKPFLPVERKQVRFRLLNGSNGRSYYIGFSDQRQFLQIGTDGGLLEKPFATNRVILAPGERAEIVADFSDGTKVMLKSFPEAGVIQTAQMFFGGQGIGDFNLIQIRPSNSEAEKKPSIDTSAVLAHIERYKEEDATVTRQIQLGGRRRGPQNTGDAESGDQRRRPELADDDEGNRGNGQARGIAGLVAGLLGNNPGGNNGPRRMRSADRPEVEDAEEGDENRDATEQVVAEAEERQQADDNAGPRRPGLGGGGGRGDAGPGGRGGAGPGGRGGAGPGGRGGAGPGGRGGAGPGGRGFAINGQAMNMHRVDERIRLGDTEIWELTNGTGGAHPFHVHLVQFQILSRNGEPPKGTDLGWKDTILVHSGDRIRIIMKFDKYADPKTPYMYHCHIMAHEDNGMMGQFLVVEEPKQLDLLKDQPTVVVFVYGLECEHCFEQVKLFDKELAEKGINLVVITPEEEPSEKRQQSVGCAIVSDPRNNWAGWFKMLHDGPAHGTLLVGGDGEIEWSSTEDTPYMDVEALIRRVERISKE